MKAWVTGLVFALYAFLVVTGLSAAFGQPVRAMAYPSFGQEPAAMRARCLVGDPDLARGLTIELLAEDGIPVRSSFRDSGDVTKFNEFLIERLACGRYQVVCVLTGRDGRQIVQRADYRVTGMCDDGASR